MSAPEQVPDVVGALRGAGYEGDTADRLGNLTRSEYLDLLARESETHRSAKRYESLGRKISLIAIATSVVALVKTGFLLGSSGFYGSALILAGVGSGALVVLAGRALQRWRRQTPTGDQPASTADDAGVLDLHLATDDFVRAVRGLPKSKGTF